MAISKWAGSLLSYIWIFNVGRGLSIFIRTPLNQGIIYDLGSSDEFSPLEFIKANILPHLSPYKKNKIAQIILSHPHIDHISEVDVISESDSPLYSNLLTCPHDKDGDHLPNEKLNWSRIKNPESATVKVETYRNAYKGRSLPLQTIQFDAERYVPNLEYGLYYIRPPKVAELYPVDDLKYGNGTSLVLYYRHGIHSILIPGDIPPEAMEYLLKEKDGCEKRYTIFDKQKAQENLSWSERTSDQPSLATCIRKNGVSILVAAHHGLESGFSEVLYKSIRNGKPDLVVISEKRHLRPQDGKVDQRYQSEEGASGSNVSIEGKSDWRYSITTRGGHHILVIFNGTGGNPLVFTDRNPFNLILK
jgi:beta-lactamase superfamily II metal-dependent hydrolase